MRMLLVGGADPRMLPLHMQTSDAVLLTRSEAWQHPPGIPLPAYRSSWYKDS